MAPGVGTEHGGAGVTHRRRRDAHPRPATGGRCPDAYHLGALDSPQLCPPSGRHPTLPSSRRPHTKRWARSVDTPAQVPHAQVMPLERFTDPFVHNEVAGRYGAYVVSFATEHHLVEAHLFREDGKLIVYVTKSPGVPVSTAQAVAREAVKQFLLGSPAADTEVVYDGYSLGRSGSM
jgi:hypothetical protein